MRLGRFLRVIPEGRCPGTDSADARHAGRRTWPTGPPREVRPTVLETLQRLDPGAAVITNRLGDLLAFTSGFEFVMAATGLVDAGEPNLTRYVFTDPRARDTFPDREQVADEQAFSLWLGPSVSNSEWFTADLAPLARPEFTSRLGQHLPPPRRRLRMRHPAVGELRWNRGTLELSDLDAQQLVVYLPADQATTDAFDQLRRWERARLRAI
jgi:hypothetical protein